MSDLVWKLLSERTPVVQNKFKSSFMKQKYGADNESLGSSPVGISSNNVGMSMSTYSSPSSNYLNRTPTGLLSSEGRTRASNFPTPKSGSNLFQESFLGSSSIKMSTLNNGMEPPILMDISEDSFASIAVDVDPASYVTSLFQDFLDLYQSYSGEHEVFDLLLQYEGNCSDKVKQLYNVLNKSVPSQQKYNTLHEMLQCMRDERNTWRLLRTLYQDRVLVEDVSEDKLIIENMGKRLSDKQIIENLFAKDPFVRQCQLVVDWLEKNAAEDMILTQRDKMEYFTDNSTSWENTLHFLMSRPRTVLTNTPGSSLITELDPDAPVRQKGNNLHSADKQDEVRLLKFMFNSVRAGNLDEAQRMAENFGQPWLAASLEGWRLFHDPNYDNDLLVDGDKLLPTEGNKYRDIWKGACWQMAREPRIPMYQQALYGVLSGNLEAITHACSSWYDYLWAYAKVAVDQRTEQELHSNTQSDRLLQELPAEYWDKVLDFEQIFQEINACNYQEVRKEGQGYHQIIQKHIILDDVDGLIENLYNWVQQDPRPSTHLMRIMTHIILFFRVICRCTKEELCVSILEAYVQELIIQKQIPLVAPYTSTLPQTHQVVWYAKFLEGITDNAERQLCLKYAEESGLDIPLITKTVVENVRVKVPAESETVSVTDATTEDDLQKINSIDWLVFDKALRGEAMKQANALMRVFVASGKLDATRQCFAKIPVDSINIIMMQSKLAGQSEMKADDDNAIREYLCFKAYVEAFDAFNDWFHHFHHAQPKCPEPPAGSNVKFVEKVAFEHEMRQYETEMQRWESAHMAQTKTTTDRLHNVLLFVNGGWMVDQRSDGKPDEGRQKQMQLLRKLCIPQITKLLHKVLHSSKLYKKCIQIADIIASERTQLYKEFTTQELGDLLSAVKESSSALLTEGLDALGYPLELTSETS